ncbi:VOC family protein [Paenibacillus polymyxa]|uniref:VOC family protein n=1 Tax=Paenibacillus polymyxa TaxID=1406 RepID=UPI0004D4E74C|nr:VOC family protein [Paenibacillus polymyxa]KEO77771.1 glyoxalase [Paenibacillus polymyxa]MCH6189334.1 VOC family protein [Paenibacillus polymyxa]MDY8094329.1 VOC family protein [Paenibacillus polymyxa]WRL58513.1 VOC family protein [Paenibacillus polymyxa]
MTESREYMGVSGKYTKKGIPNGFTSITPFITVENPSEAIEFYKSVFNARVKDITEFPNENGNKIIVHAELDFGNGFLQLGAANPTYQLVLPPDGDNACYSFGIYVMNVDQVIEKAVARGAKVREPVTNFVSGDRFGSILDPCGVRWSIMTRIEDLSEEESSRRVAEWAKSLSGE